MVLEDEVLGGVDDWDGEKGWWFWWKIYDSIKIPIFYNHGFVIFILKYDEKKEESFFFEL